MTYEMVIFDFDGTLTSAKTIWQILHLHLNVDMNKRNDAKQQFENGDMTKKEWVSHDINLWKEKNVKKSDIKEALSKIKLNKNALKLLALLKEKRLKIALISESLDILINMLLPDNKNFFDYVNIFEMTFDNDGFLDGWKGGKETKTEALLDICKKTGIQPSGCIFVGDEKNDIELAKLCGYSIALNANKELEKVCSIAIHSDDLMDVYEVIMKIL